MTARVDTHSCLQIVVNTSADVNVHTLTFYYKQTILQMLQILMLPTAFMGHKIAYVP